MPGTNCPHRQSHAQIPSNIQPNKDRSRIAKLLALAVAPAAVAIWANPSHAQTLTWDATPTNPAAPNDGSGSWDTSSNANWSNGAADVFWTNGQIASIGDNGTAGLITIDDSSGSVSAAGINFNPVSSGSYTIAAQGSDSLFLTGGINVAAGANGPTITAPIAGSSGLTLSGAGSLNLAGANTFTGGVGITNGTINVATGGTLGNPGDAIQLGAVNGGTTVGSLSIAPGVTTTVGSFASATNTASINTLTIGSGALLNVNSNLAATGVNAAFLLGSQTAPADCHDDQRRCHRRRHFKRHRRNQ